jgi:hypothetical protein
MKARFWLAWVERPSAAGFALPFVFSQLPMAKSQEPVLALGFLPLAKYQEPKAKSRFFLVFPANGQRLKANS